MDVSSVRRLLHSYVNKERKAINERFFKTGKGCYGEGDQFIGVRVPDVRRVARQYVNMSLDDVEHLLHSAIHEERLLAIIIVVMQSMRARQRGDRKHQRACVDFYLKNTQWVNSWDLVDVSARQLVGYAVYDSLKERALLTRLVKSPLLWERRIGIVASWAFIKEGDVRVTLSLAQHLLSDTEDLIHKAVGWMLRECWKVGENKKHADAGTRAQECVEAFIERNYQYMPRTMLRYAIERMPQQQRARFLAGDFGEDSVCNIDKLQ